MESVVVMGGEWISLGEMIKLQELSTLISDVFEGVAGPCMRSERRMG